MNSCSIYVIIIDDGSIIAVELLVESSDRYRKDRMDDRAPVQACDDGSVAKESLGTSHLHDLIYHTFAL